MVPATLVVICVFSSSWSLASPKSDIFGFRSLSRSTLVGLMSRWTIFRGDSSCRKANPLAIPTQIFCLVGQSNFGRYSSGPAIYCKIETRQIHRHNMYADKWIYKLENHDNWQLHYWGRMGLSSFNFFKSWLNVLVDFCFKQYTKNHLPNKAWERLLFSMYS